MVENNMSRGFYIASGAGYFFLDLENSIYPCRKEFFKRMFARKDALQFTITIWIKNRRHEGPVDP